MNVVYYGPPLDDDCEGGPVIKFPRPVTAQDLAQLIGDPTEDGVA